MIKILKENFAMYLTILLFVGFSAWWIVLNFFSASNVDNSEIFSALYGIIALIGGIYGIAVARKWGGFKSALGSAIMWFSFGLLAQEFGQIAYSYYSIVLGVEVPYPSIGDIGYYGTIPLYFIALVQLGKAVDVKFSLGLFKKNWFAILIPLLMLGISYKVFLSGGDYDWSSPLTTLLELANPLGQALYISVALLVFFLSIKGLGGLMRGKVLLILFALLCQYVADFVFLYTANRDTWVTAGANEYMYLFAYFMMTMAIMGLNSVFNRIRRS